MADGILGLGSGQASTLNQELIDKLRDAERKSTVEPIENRLDAITRVGTEDGKTSDGEALKLAAITAKANELLEAIKPFDLYVTGGVGVFDQKTANVTGTSVVFDAASEASLNEGTTTVHVDTLAKRDVFQSYEVNSATKNADIVGGGDLIIALAGADNSYSTSYTFDTTGKTYDELATEINYNSNLTASVEQVGDDSYRLVIKSADSGLANALQITGAASQTLGYTSDGTTEIVGANVQEASNLIATVNGINYNVSSNVITVDSGLKITAVEEGSSSTISIENDTTSIGDYMQYFVNTYNELVALVGEELYSADSPMEDTSSLRTMIEGIKEKLFATYGTNDDLSVFNFGFELDKSGTLSLDTDKLNEIIENNLGDLKSLFLGVAEDEGLGTQLKTYIDDLDGLNGILYTYKENMNNRQEKLETEKEKAEKALESKYSLLAQQFASYSTLITQMESSFSGLSLMIKQSVASN